MHAPILVTTTHLGCHCPPNLIGTPPTHLLAQCHQPHSTFPSMSPGATLMLTFMCTHTPDLGSTIHLRHHCSTSPLLSHHPFPFHSHLLSVHLLAASKDLLGCLFASSLSPLAGPLNYCSMNHGQITFSFWVISWCNPWRPTRAQP